MNLKEDRVVHAEHIMACFLHICTYTWNASFPRCFLLLPHLFSLSIRQRPTITSFSLPIWLTPMSLRKLSAQTRHPHTQKKQGNPFTMSVVLAALFWLWFNRCSGKNETREPSLVCGAIQFEDGALLLILTHKFHTHIFTPLLRPHSSPTDMVHQWPVLHRW